MLDIHHSGPEPSNYVVMFYLVVFFSDTTNECIPGDNKDILTWTELFAAAVVVVVVMMIVIAASQVLLLYTKAVFCRGHFSRCGSPSRNTRRGAKTVWSASVHDLKSKHTLHPHCFWCCLITLHCYVCVGMLEHIRWHNVKSEGSFKEPNFCFDCLFIKILPLFKWLSISLYFTLFYINHLSLDRFKLKQITAKVNDRLFWEKTVLVLIVGNEWQLQVVFVSVSLVVSLVHHWCESAERCFGLD